tara:strand:- start:359 stop:1219 length:861 start_codon:yes stop_codon:yes gene_type:complete
LTLIADLLSQDTTFSFEFYPPRSEKGTKQLMTTMEHLLPYNPSFISVTYGAGGSSRQQTLDIVKELKHNTRSTILPHLTCIGHTRNEIKSLINQYIDIGITDILALHGDQPKDSVALPEGDFRFATELIDFLRTNYDLTLGVAAHTEGHPAASTRLNDLDHQSSKIRAADFAITQFFFDIDHYISFCNEMEKRNVSTPIIPGIIPVTNPAEVNRMIELAGGTFPKKLWEEINSARNQEERQFVGVNYAVQLIKQLLRAGAPGIHIYPMNRWQATEELLEHLGFSPH